jgi:hypothetical protein
MLDGLSKLIAPLGFYFQSDPRDICDNIQYLLGAFETATGEQVYYIVLFELTLPI